MITVICPHCNNRMRAAPEYVGRKGRCPTCKALVEITASAGDQSLATLRPTSSPSLRAPLRDRYGTTDVPGWLTGLLGAAATALLYLLIFLPLRDAGAIKLFMQGGVVTGLNVLITCWGIAILILKYRAVRRQQSYAELELEFIPLEIGLQITASNVDQFLAHLSELRSAQRLSILGRRIHGALEHFKNRQSASEVQEYLASQAAIDASMVESGYTLLRAFIWCNPILGFIGTVVGISFAVGGLAESFGADAADLRAGLEPVTKGLATAFDTTLIGLAMTILLLFPTESLRKVEYRMLDRIEGFTNESLLRRLKDDSRSADADLPDIVREALESAFQEHQRWLAQWQAQVAQLGQVIGAEFEASVSRILQQLAEKEGPRMEQIESASRSLSALFERTGQATADWLRPGGPDGADPAHANSVLTAVARLEQALLENARLIAHLAERMDGVAAPTVVESSRKGLFGRRKR